MKKLIKILIVALGLVVFSITPVFSEHIGKSSLVIPPKVVVSSRDDRPTICTALYSEPQPYFRGVPFAVIEKMEGDMCGYYNKPNFFTKFLPLGLILNVIFITGVIYVLNKIFLTKKGK